MSILYLLKLNPVLLFIIISSVLLLIDFIIYFLFKHFYKNIKVFKLLLITHIFFTIFITSLLFWAFFIVQWQPNPYIFKKLYYITNFLPSIYLAKIAYVVVSATFFIVRKKIVQKIAIYFAIIVLILLLWGTLWGRFNFTTYTYKINLPELNEENKLKIVQISDLHIGQFISHPQKFRSLVYKVNELNPDIIVITGDFLCFFAQEMEPFICYLNQLKAKIGVYGVLGNHDYGDYYSWKNHEEKEQNHQLFLNYVYQSGIKLLQNESVLLNNTSFVYLAGIENYGKKPYPRRGNIDKAMHNIPDSSSVILLAHDPIIWNEKVNNKYSNIVLTLSGHIHGYQIAGFRTKTGSYSIFSKKEPWNGLYQKNNQFLYISNGISSTLYIARLAMWPEITIFELN